MSVPADKHELYAEFGVASEMAQVLELAAGNFALDYLCLFFNPDEITDEQRAMFRSLIDDVNQMTLGRLLKNIKTSATFDQNFLDTVETALERRNYLMHRFFRTHNFAINGEEGRRVMIEELKDIQNDLNRAHAILYAASKCLQAQTGWNKVIDERAQRLASEGKRINI